MNTQPFTIKRIAENSPYLEEIIDLGDANSATLGFLPEAAFSEYAERREILLALTEGEQLAGYLLYRTSARGTPRSKAIIVHLCVRLEWRGHDLARRLVELLSRVTQEHAGIGLHCRRDYEASKVWPRLGFSARTEKRGRSQNGSTLTYWWRSHHQRNLFTDVEAGAAEEALDVAIDANVFYDLEGHADEDSEESLALVQDPFRPFINLRVTKELWNEIDRGSDSKEEREKQKRAVRNTYQEIKSLPARFDEINSELLGFEPLRQEYPDPLSERDRSDIRHLAHTIASGTLFFVTRDDSILDASDALYDEYGLTTLRPAELVVRVGQLREEAKSQPHRLAGTLVEIRSVDEYQEEEWTEHFYHHDTGEKLSDFKRGVRSYVADASRYACSLVIADGEFLAFMVIDQGHGDQLRIPFLRIAKSQSALTVGFHLVFRAVRRSAKQGKPYTIVEDTHLDERIEETLEEDGFVNSGGQWIKTTLLLAQSISETVESLRHIEPLDERQAQHHERLAQILEEAGPEEGAGGFSYVEKRIWPGKVTDAPLPTFVVPIWPRWARHLFDEQLASGTLFGAKRDLALNREGVYYRAKGNARGLRAPGRVLWYVSRGPKEIRACSRIDEVEIGKPKSLFGKYKRLGVFRWKDVFEVANGDLDREIMAVKFSDTELFEHPVPLREVKQIIKGEEGATPIFASPRSAPPPVFERIYKRGRNL